MALSDTLCRMLGHHTRDNMNKILTLLLFPIFVYGQQSDSVRLEKYIIAFSSLNKFSGTILVIKDNKPIIKKSFGFADIEKKNLNSIDTKFRIGSCSKQFTAIAILQLQEKGKLSVSDKLSKYFPNIPKSDSITIDMLLTHRSGIHDYCNDEAFEKINNPLLTKKKVMEILENDSSDFSPGSRYQYSNGGYFLLASIIEKASNISFNEYMINNIFKKAKMFSSGVDRNDTTIKNKAKGYVYKNDKLVLAPYDNMDGAMGNGNLYSTANDIYKYYLALKDTILLTKKSRQQFLTPANENKIKGLTPASGRYAYGVIDDTLEMHPFVTHGGWVYGFTSDITFFFKDNAVFVILSNNESRAWDLSQGLRAVLFNVPVIYPYKYKEIKVETKSLEKFIGQYGGIKIYIKENYLYLNDTSGPEGEIKLIPETETKFFYEDENNRQVEFRLDKDKKVINSWVIASGIKYELKPEK